jgi:hypothetical protein
MRLAAATLVGPVLHRMTWPWITLPPLGERTAIRNHHPAASTGMRAVFGGAGPTTP